MTTTTLTRAPKTPPAPRRRARPRITGHFEETITGRYRPIPTRQLALAWWLHLQGRISRRQLRVFFAAHEMAERRRYGKDRCARQGPLYRLEEVQALVGGRGSESATRALSADIKALAEIGLVEIAPRGIRFAKSTDTLAVGEGGGEAFTAFLETIPNKARTVPVPRRTLRALAAGFSRAETAYVIAALIRSVFWHRQSGLYRVDGRMKLSEVHQAFGVSRRAFTDARARLIELGWLRPLEVPQWAANRYGVHDVVNVHWGPPVREQDTSEASTDPSTDSVDNQPAVGEGSAAESASPRRSSAGESASPCLNSSTSSTRNQNTRTLGAAAPGPAPAGNRRRKTETRGAPRLRDMQAHDLEDAGRLLTLHQQAMEAGLAQGGEGGQLDFFAMANRARTRGSRPGALLYWFLRERKTEFITIADEEAARRRLREHREGPDVRSSAEPAQRRLSPDEQVVEVSIRVAKQQRIADPFRIAQQVKGWTRARWDEAQFSYQATQAQQWQ